MLFKHISKEAYLLADAYDGEEIKTCIEDFLRSSNEQLPIQINYNSQPPYFGENSDLLVYVGHDGLMDFDVTITYKKPFQKTTHSMSFQKQILTIFLLVMFISCKRDTKTIDVSHIPVSVEISRFDRDFFKSDSVTIKEVRKKYPHFFPEQKTDSFWLAQKNDSLAMALYLDSQNVFKDFKEERKEFTDLFQHIKYYYPNFLEPKVVTLISHLDLEHQVIYADSLLILSLDTFLGSENKHYSNYPEYLKTDFNKEQLMPAVAKSIIKKMQPEVPYRVFIEKIVAFGKEYYAMYQFLPKIPETALLNYNEAQLKWAQENEEELWKYFVEKEYLYSTDKDMQRRFLDPAPFSKFYLVFDNESPGRIGRWLGYQIVRSFMENNTVSLPELMATPPIDIFNRSKYKPQRSWQ